MAERKNYDEVMREQEEVKRKRRKEWNEAEFKIENQNGNFTIIPNEVIDDKYEQFNLEHSEFRLYVVLIRLSYRKDAFTASRGYLAKAAKMSGSTVSKGIEKLESVGLIDVRTKTAQNGWKENVFILKNVHDVVKIPEQFREQCPTTGQGVCPTIGPGTVRSSDQGMSGHRTDTVRSSDLSNKKKEEQDKKIIKKKERSLFELPKTDPKKVTLEAKIKVAIASKQMLGLNDFRAYYNQQHLEILGCNPGGKPTNDSTKGAISALVNDWEIPESMLVAIIPNLLKHYKEISEFQRLSFYMLSTQLNNETIARAVALAKADLQPAEPKKKREIVDEIF